MRHIFVNIIMAFFLILSCSNPERETPPDPLDIGKSNNGKAEIHFEDTKYDFGRVIQGEKVGWHFNYKNVGDAPLIIKNVSSSCGCTVPEFDKEPLSPGEKSSLKVIYDSRGRSGKDFKTVRVETNAENNIVKLDLTVEIITK